MKSKKISKKMNADESKNLIVTYRISLTDTPEYSEGSFAFDEKSRILAKYIRPIFNTLSKAYKTSDVKAVEHLPYIDFNILGTQQEFFQNSNLILAQDLMLVGQLLEKNASQDTPLNPSQVVSNTRAFEVAKSLCKDYFNPQVIQGSEVYRAPHIPQKHFTYSPGEQSDSVISHDIRITGFNFDLFANLKTLVAISANKDYEILIDISQKKAFALALIRLFRGKDVYLVGGIFFDTKLRKWIMNANAYFEYDGIISHP